MLPLETVKKPSGRVAAHGYLAWGRMEFPFVGRLSVCYDCGRKISLFKNIESVHLYMMILIPLSWLPFAVAEIRNIVVYLERLFPFFNAPGAYTWYAGDYLKYGQMYVWPLLAGLIFITPWPRKIYEKYKGSLISAVVLLMLFWFSIYCIYMGQDDPFLYFSF